MVIHPRYTVAEVHERTGAQPTVLRRAIAAGLLDTDPDGVRVWIRADALARWVCYHASDAVVSGYLAAIAAGSLPPALSDADYLGLRRRCPAEDDRRRAMLAPSPGC